MTNPVFGPVPSRRLGRSLGLDLVPFKTCSYDCIYCQLGPTTCKTLEKREWVSLDEVLDALRPRLASRPDYVTLSGSGEPTLHSQVGELIDRIKTMTEVPVAVLTNGSLLWQEDVRRQLMGADLVVPSLDAGSEPVFQFVNRPHEAISFAQMLEGLVEFRRAYRGAVWLEVFVLGDYGDLAMERHALIDAVAQIAPDRVQLNTVTRPPAETFARGASPEQLAEWAEAFSPKAEIVADYRGVHQRAEYVAGREQIADLLRRRPCSVDDIAQGLGLHRNEVVKYVQELREEGLLEESLSGDKRYLRIPV